MQHRRHNVSVLVGTTRIERWTSYEIESDMLSVCDDFTLTLAPADEALFTVCKPDSAVQVFIDDVRVLSGFIGQRAYRKSRDAGGVLTITGRDRGGRLEDESMPLIEQLGKLDLKTLAEKAAGEWFSEIRFSNAENRALVRGRRSVLASAWAEPSTAEEVAEKQALLEKYSKTQVKSLDGQLVVYAKPKNPGGLFEAKKVPKKVEPGQTRADVLRSVLEPAHMLCWSTADGRALVIGIPNHSQEPQFQFFVPKDSRSQRRGFANTLDFEVIDSVEERYSQITVMGATKGDGATYGRALQVATSAEQGPNADGTGDDFQHPKRLIIADDEVKSARDARSRANREMALRDKTRRWVRIVADGHGQRYNRDSTAEAIFAFDTVADVLEEGVGVGGRYLITGCRFTSNADDGEQTSLTLVPIWTELTL
jgi:prophage tail gpP-like protein